MNRFIVALGVVLVTQLGCSLLVDLPGKDTSIIDTSVDSTDAADSLADSPDIDADPDTVVDPDTVLDTDPDTTADPDVDPDTMDDPDIETEETCTPDCAGRECGPDPVCGVDCGTCSHVEDCEEDGHCGPRWAAISAGTFTMGSPVTEPGRGVDEDQHSVTLTHDFEIQTTEVTQKQFERMTGYNSLPTPCEDCPIWLISWHEAAKYCNLLSNDAGLATCYTCTGSGVDVVCSWSSAFSSPYDCPGYRLPTEAEWEYAARAGTTTGTYNGTCDAAHLACEEPNPVLDSIAWFCGNSEHQVHEVGLLSPNTWGLFDVLGNVYEWCQDWYEPYAGDAADPWGPVNGTSKVTRGAAYDYESSQIRAAFRGIFGREFRGGIGIRPVRTTAYGTWVTILPGTFTMGSPETEPGREADETQHEVTLTYSFMMQTTEVTQAHFESLMGYNPSTFSSCGPDCPVETVTWHEAAAYCNALSAVAELDSCYTCSGVGTGMTCSGSLVYASPVDCPGYRLPSQEEWEFSARAGTTTGTYNGTTDAAHLVCEEPNVVLDSIAWFCGNSAATTHEVGQLSPNAWGLFDMLGNVWEWCTSGSATARGIRGGSWDHWAWNARAADLGAGFTVDGYDHVGFRPIRTLP